LHRSIKAEGLQTVEAVVEAILSKAKIEESKENFALALITRNGSTFLNACFAATRIHISLLHLPSLIISLFHSTTTGTHCFFGPENSEGLIGPQVDRIYMKTKDDCKGTHVCVCVCVCVCVLLT
jgi:hypothetical protein